MENEIRNIDYKDINRNSLYWVAIPFSEERPLKIFEKLENTVNAGNKLDENNNTFDGSINEFGRKQSEIIDVVVRHKRRLAIVIQDNKFNHDKNYGYVYVVPLTTFNKNKKRIKLIKENMDIPNYHYVGFVGNEESVANIGDVKRIHKSLLLETTKYKSLKNEIMEDVCKKVAIMLKVEKLEKCDECIYNYENNIKVEEKDA